jgi:hypothetical protein
MMVPKEVLEYMARSSSKVTKEAKLLVGVRIYVAENIDKRLRHYAGSLGNSFEAGTISGRIQALRNICKRIHGMKIISIRMQ